MADHDPFTDYLGSPDWAADIEQIDTIYNREQPDTAYMQYIMSLTGYTSTEATASAMAEALQDLTEAQTEAAIIGALGKLPDPPPDPPIATPCQAPLAALPPDPDPAPPAYLFGLALVFLAEAGIVFLLLNIIYQLGNK